MLIYSFFSILLVFCLYFAYMKVKKISETLHCGKLENQTSRTGTLLGGLAGLDGTLSVPLWQGVDLETRSKMSTRNQGFCAREI